MSVIDRDTLARIEVIDRAEARFIHGNAFTLAFWELQKGAHFPLHSHPHEMSPNITKGKIKLIVDGEAFILSAGQSFLIPPNAEHEAFALEDSEVIDVFTPIREDYLALEKGGVDQTEMYLEGA